MQCAFTPANSPDEGSQSLATTLSWPPARPHRDRNPAAELPPVLRATRLQLGVAPGGLLSVRRERRVWSLIGDASTTPDCYVLV